MIETKKLTQEIDLPCNENYCYKLYSSIAEVNEEIWQQIINDENDLAMNRQLIKLTEKSLEDQAKFWTIIFFHQDLPVACACLSFFRVDTIQSSSASIQKTINKFRQYWPNLLKMGVLFCGLPAPSGESHIRFTKEKYQKPVLTLLIKIMRQLASVEKARLIVFKEFNENRLSEVKTLLNLGFIQSILQPIHELQFSFSNFNQFYEAIRSSYRHQIKANLKKFEDPKLKILHTVNADEIYKIFTPEIYQLYLTVWKNSKERLEQFPHYFFQNLGYALPNKTLLTIIYEEDKPIAFTIGIKNTECYYNLYCGVDYFLKEKYDLYFNLFYQGLDFVFQQKSKLICLGQTSDNFKLRIGSTPSQRYFFVRANNIVGQLGLKLFKSLIFPKPPLLKPLHVLKDNQAKTIKNKQKK